MVLDRDVGLHSALVVDGNATSRSVLCSQLRDFGFGNVKGVNRTADAREQIELQRFHLIICDDRFEQGESTGQELLDELRREQMLPYSTVFVMLTSQATYASVAEAAEAALDSYIVKPFSANVLFERLKEARQRKRVLKDVFEALEAKQTERAAELCLARFQQRQLYWLYAARIGAELLLQLRRNEEAKALYDAVSAAKPVPWAQLGVARAQLGEGEVALARKTLEALIPAHPQFTDGLDVLGRVHVEQGNLAEALETYRSAAQMTPGCILRLQHCGTLSFYAGETDTATAMLERTWQLGHKSRLFDVLSMMLLALMRFDAGDTKSLMGAQEIMQSFSARYPESLRLRRMADLGAALVAVNRGQLGTALATLRSELDNLPRADFDMEAATNLLSVWSRLGPHGVDGAEIDDVTTRLSARFSVSRSTCEVLVAAARPCPAAEALIRAAYAQTMQIAEQAMNLSLKGEPRQAVESLLVKGQDSGNAKLIEMAGLVARRHQERIDDVQALLDRAATLATQFCTPTTHIAGVRRTGRSAGGLVLRR